MVEPPSQHVNNHGYAIYPPSPPPGFGTPTGAPAPTTPLLHSVCPPRVEPQLRLDATPSLG
eukprot:1585349-Prorocentrum_lima.AAC.1